MQSVNHDLVYAKEQEAKRQILAEMRQREAVKRISAKYDAAAMERRKSKELLDDVGDDGSEIASDKTNTIDSSSACTISDDPIYNKPPVNDPSTKSAQPALKYNTRKKPDDSSSGYKSGGLSDTASDISGKTASSSSSLSLTETRALNSPENVILTDHDIAQVELFYQSHKTEVHVCRCMANLYFGNAAQKLVRVPDWKLYATGIPVLVLDTGLHHRTRRLFFVLAERGSGFVLWKDILDNLSKYSSPHANFHTLQVSTDHTKLAGVSFDETPAAAEFYRIFQGLTANREDDLMKVSSTRSANRKDKRKSKCKGPKKSEISQPCCFVHMTTLQKPDLDPVCDLDNFNYRLNKSVPVELDNVKAQPT